MREIIAILFFFSAFSALSSISFTFLSRYSFSEASRKSYAALKSQANAMTFIFLSGLILSQSLIIASNFTGPSMDSAVLLSGTPTGLVVSGAADGSGDLPVNDSSAGSGENGAQPSEISAPPTPENPAEISPDAPAAEGDVTFGTPEIGTEEDNIPADNNASAPSGEDSSAGDSEQPVIFPENGTDLSPLNESGNIASGGDDPVSVPESSPAVIDISLNISDNIKRGESFSLLVEITNTGESSAKNVAVDFVLPDGVSFASGEKPIGEIPDGESVLREFIFKSSYGASLGANKIKVRVTYE